MSTLVEVHGLVKSFGAIRALDGISTSIESGGPVGLVGRNGAGKTTFLSILAGVFPPGAGQVQLCGLPLGHPGLRGKTGVLMQDANLKRGVSGLRQLRHFGRLAGLSSAAALRQARDLLEQLGGGDFAARAPEQLSYGQRQRLGIAQALLGEPKLVLLDEPTAGLDPVVAGTVRDLIRSRSSDTTFIVSSHNLYEIQDICSRVIIIDNGKLISDTDMASLAEAQGNLTITLNKEPQQSLLEALGELPEVLTVRHERGHPVRVEIQFAAAAADTGQLKVQTVINDQGYSVIALNRGQGMLDRVLKILETGAGPSRGNS